MEKAGEVKNTEFHNTNIIRVSTKKNPNYYVFMAKNKLKEFGTVEFHAIENASHIAVIAAETLVRNEYAEWERI